MTTDKREALIKKIQALQEKTVKNGCTEEEAAAAAALAGRLMTDYGLSMAEIETTPDKDDLCETGFYQSGRQHGSPNHPVQYCQNAVAAWTNTKCWKSGCRLKFFGLAADVQVAVYLSGVFRAAMDFEWKRYWKEAKHDSCDAPITARKGFMLGMASRLRSRLHAMIKNRKATEATPESDSRALVVIKHQIVEHAYTELGLKLRSQRVDRYRGSGDHLTAGRDAGDRVHIPAAGLNQGQAPKHLK